MSATNVAPYSILQANIYTNVTPGAFSLNTGTGSFYFYGSTYLPNYSMQNMADKYALLPGYSIYVSNSTNAQLLSKKNTSAFVEILTPSTINQDYYVWLWYGSTILVDPFTGSSTLNNIPVPAQPTS